jgi:methylmalonyl-CoA/ethylmalonyl-CoA epimerase
MADGGAGQVLPFLKNGIAQVAIIVKDLEEAVENYWSLFGIDDWHFYTYGRPLVKRMTYQGQPSDYKWRIWRWPSPRLRPQD